MNPINLSRVVNNPAFQLPFTVNRNVYELRNEGENTLVSTQTFPAVGIVTPTETNDRAEYLPEGQREADAITIFSPSEIRMSDGNGQESDVIVWQGKYYRVQFSKPFQPWGYWMAIATGFVHHGS